MDYAGTKMIRNPWTDRLSEVNVYRVKGSARAESANLFEFYYERSGDKWSTPFRFDFVEEDDQWCLGQRFSQVHFTDFQVGGIHCPLFIILMAKQAY